MNFITDRQSAVFILSMESLEKESRTRRSGSRKTKVIVIGAGIAGIGVGETFIKNDFTDFIILEASNRTGGRIWTNDLGKFV